MEIFRLNFGIVQTSFWSSRNCRKTENLRVGTCAKLIAYFKNLYPWLDKEHRQIRCAIYFPPLNLP